MTHDEAINHIRYSLIEGKYPLSKELGTEVLECAIKSLEDELKARKIIWDSTTDPYKIIQLRKLYPW